MRLNRTSSRRRPSPDAGRVCARFLLHIFALLYNKKDVTSAELKRWLEKQGCTFGAQKGSHLKVYLDGRQTVLPMHAKEMKTGTVRGSKKAPGLK